MDLRKINFNLVEQILEKTRVTEANYLKSILGFGILGVEGGGCQDSRCIGWSC
jgi:hypothetical protein